MIAALLTISLVVGALSLSHLLHAEAAEAESELPSEYCMRDEYIIYTQNQDKHGYCWNFAATMSAATAIMKATGEYYDFSELWSGISLFNTSDSYKKMGAGGGISSHYEAMKKSGLMLETDLPYQYSYTSVNENAADYYNFFEKYSNDDLADCLVYDSSTRFSSSKVEEIKHHVYEHGSVYMAFSFGEGFVESDGTYYLPPNQVSTSSSHAISIIGWDDNYEREVYLNGADTPTLFKGAWLVLNSYTEKNGDDGISRIFYEDKNITSMAGYKYEPDTDKELYFYDKIEAGYSYPTSVKGEYYGNFTAEPAMTVQKNIFYDDVNLEYSYMASDGADIESVDIYLGGRNVTDDFTINVDSLTTKFYISAENAAYGQYKVLVTYGNGEDSDTYLNNFFVTHGLVGEELEYDRDNGDFTFNPGRDIEYFSFIRPEKNYVVYTDKLSGSIAFLPTEQSVYSEKNMSLPEVSYEITDGKSCTSTYTLTSETGYELVYSFTFVYCADTSLQPVNVYYELGGGINNAENYAMELAGPGQDLLLYAPTREGYTFAGWYLDYGNGSLKLPEEGGAYRVSWENIRHLGENPTLNASSYYKQYYSNSNTLFVYARWAEEEYYSVELSLIGEGTSQINTPISIASDDAVRYLLKPASGYCVSSIKINGTPISSEEIFEAAERGLLVSELSRDTSIEVTFSRGVYLLLNYGENVSAVYLVGEVDGVSRKFYSGDFIPYEYFTDDGLRFYTIIGSSEADESSALEKLPSIDTPIIDKPVFQLPLSGTAFTLVVELPEDNPGYTYVLEGIEDFSPIEAGVFRKKVYIERGDGQLKISVGSATEKPTEAVSLTYSVGANVLGHYISADKNALSGSKNSATYSAGDIVYLFIKTHVDTVAYHYAPPDWFESVGDGWYRRAIYVSADNANLGSFSVARERQKYTVTWKNWDGSVIYSEIYRWGDMPEYYYRQGEVKDAPERPSDELYSYIFIGWDSTPKTVVSNAAYTAIYEAVPRRYALILESGVGGSITNDGHDYISINESRTFSFVPEAGYRVKDVKVGGVSVGALTSYTLTSVNSDQTISVEFEKIKYSLSVIPGDGGAVDTNGVTEVEHGSDVTVNITPLEYFLIDFIRVNGEDMEISASLSLVNVTEDIAVEVGFKRMTFEIITSGIGRGGVTPSFVAEGGKSARIDFRADFCHRVKDVRIDGVSIGVVDSYTFVLVDRAHTVEVEYEADAALIAVLSASSAVMLGGVAAVTVVAVKKRKSKEQNSTE